MAHPFRVPGDDDTTDVSVATPSSTRQKRKRSATLDSPMLDVAGRRRTRQQTLSMALSSAAQQPARASTPRRALTPPQSSTPTSASPPPCAPSRRAREGDEGHHSWCKVGFHVTQTLRPNGKPYRMTAVCRLCTRMGRKCTDYKVVTPPEESQKKDKKRWTVVLVGVGVQGISGIGIALWILMHYWPR